MKTLYLGSSDEDIGAAAEIIKKGGLAAIPTETVYGLGADALNGDAVKKIFEAKGRPGDNPLIVHICEEKQVYDLAREVPVGAQKLMKRFWPGPLTIIMPKKDIVPDVTSGGLDTVAIRLPAKETARKIIRAAGVPIAAPSANTSGIPSPTSARHVMCDMDGKIDAVVDGGECEVGVESTVVSFISDRCRLLRPGGITLDMLRDCVGEVEVDDAVFSRIKEGEKAASPGMKYKHYSPKASVTIVKGDFSRYKAFVERHSGKGVFALCFAGEEKCLSLPCVTFGESDDVSSQAHMLFSALRELDDKGAQCVYARCPSREGVGMAVYNRLIRAAGYKVIDLEEPMIIGLTGPTGAGKGYICDIMNGLGVAVIDTDDISKRITKKGSKILPRLQEAFGEDVVIKGELDRSLLAKRVFLSKQKQLMLNSITHPEIIRLSLIQIEKLSENGYDRIVIDAPLLFESEMNLLCSKVICVLADRQVRKNRIMARDNISANKAEERMQAQPDDDFYLSRSDFSLYNNGAENLHGDVKNILKMLEAERDGQHTVFNS